jgi:glycosyltransferase involved in cell wall biosynthesis
MNEAVNKLSHAPADADQLIAIPCNLLMPTRLDHSRACVDIDFSLAIHNRTGKYFIGEELLALPDLPFGDVYYWRRRAMAPPDGLFGRVIGRLQHWQVLGRTIGGPFSLLPRRRSKRPLLHLDPFTVPTTVLSRRDAVLIHDFGPLSHPDLFPPNIAAVYRPVYDEIARVGPHLVFVSQASRSAFEALYPHTQPNSARIIYPPIRPGTGIGGAAGIAGIEPPFLLTVGSLGHRKNQVRSIAAFACSGLAARGVRYVICGGTEPGHEAVAEAAARTAGVHLLPYVTDAELSWLYAQASGFVLMSLLEGFGMPVSEAVRHGLVPLVSRGGVLHEVAGDGALEADPADVAEIALQMEKLVDMPADMRRERLAQLAVAVERFDIVHFHRGWRGLFRDMLAVA